MKVTKVNCETLDLNPTRPYALTGLV